jgi:hypothetical protein
MEKQNVTLSIPKDILRKAKIVAVEQDTSLSGLLTQALIEIVEKSDQYMVAKQQHMAQLAQVGDLGTQGQIAWKREALHQR